MVTVQTVLELLTPARRRYALYCLDERESPVHVDDLAEAVARLDSEEGTSELSDETVDRYRLSLELTHLPQAAAYADFIEYDPGAGVVRVTAEPATYESLISVAKVLELPT